MVPWLWLCLAQECGLVLESHAIEETSEWRSFSDSDKAARGDPNRVGGPSNPLLTSGGLGTSLAKPTDAASHALSRMHSRGPDPDRALLASFAQISALCSLLGLPASAKDSAHEIFATIKAQKTVKKRNVKAIHAAIVYIACRQQGIERTFREICGGAEGTTVKEIGRAYRAIVDALETTHTAMATVAVHDDALCARLTAALSLPPEFGRASREIARAARKLMEEEIAGMDSGTRKQPLTIAGASLWLAVTLHGGAPTGLSDVSRVTSMAEETILTAARWLFPYVRELCAGCSSEFRREEAVVGVEAAHPQRTSGAQRLGTLVESCVGAPELAPPQGLTEGQRADVATAASALAVAALAHERTRALASATQPRPLAAAAVWLALRLAGLKTSMLQIRAAGGIAAPQELRCAAAVLFPHARALSASVPSALFRSDEAVARIEEDHARMLWLGDAPALALDVARAAGEAHRLTVAPDGAPEALAAAVAARCAGMTLQDVPALGLAASVAGAAALLLFKLRGASAPSLHEAAAAAFVPAPAVAAVAGLVFPYARAMAGDLPPCVEVTAEGLEALESEVPPPMHAVPQAPEVPGNAGGLLGGALDDAPSFWVPDM